MGQKEIRQKRLRAEFEGMSRIRIIKQGLIQGLIDFRCADLSEKEQRAFLSAWMNLDEVRKGLEQGLLTPEDYARKFPDRAPEKYLVEFRCTGVERRPTGECVRRDEHFLEIVFGLDYPSVPPRYVWLTPIWHPNIRPPYLCTDGQPFAVGTTLEQVCLLVGQMIQYRSYNVDDPLNKDAAGWARANRERLPVDTRGLLDGKENARPLVALVGGSSVEWTDRSGTAPPAREAPAAEGRALPSTVELL